MKLESDCKDKKKKKQEAKRKGFGEETYNTRDSLVVADTTTSLTLQRLFF